MMAKWTPEDEGISDRDRELHYEALWIDMHYDLYVNHKAAEHAHYIKWYGIEKLPYLIEQEMCANSEADVWSLQATVFSGRFTPRKKFEPWWERHHPIPGISE